ncbi:MAG: hypothetical protein IVW51_01095 [Thermaceae bacterium]|nr:hypothetical protein [Thermaceae bacterium]
MNKALMTLSVAVLCGALSLAQTQTAPEPRSVGDIPDSQAFVRYTNAEGGYSLEVPEGWARTVQGSSSEFAAKFNRLSLSLQKVTAMPTMQSVKTAELKILQKDRSVQVKSVKAVSLPSGSAVLIQFESQSQPNAVTGQRVALENDLYLLYKGGREIMLTLSAPKGADNVDAWKRMAHSFTWR